MAPDADLRPKQRSLNRTRAIEYTAPTCTGAGPHFDKIFNVGLNRAGTGSLTQALRILGFRAVHFECDGRRVYDIVQENVHMDRKLLSGLDTRFERLL